MVDLTLELVTLKDEATPQRDGSVLRQKIAVFYLGKFGPFTERFPVGEFTDAALKLRVQQLKTHLESLHR